VACDVRVNYFGYFYGGGFAFTRGGDLVLIRPAEIGEFVEYHLFFFVLIPWIPERRGSNYLGGGQKCQCSAL